jgi:hypothetical protein
MLAMSTIRRNRFRQGTCALVVTALSMAGMPVLDSIWPDAGGKAWAAQGGQGNGGGHGNGGGQGGGKGGGNGGGQGNGGGSGQGGGNGGGQGGGQAGGDGGGGQGQAKGKDKGKGQGAGDDATQSAAPSVTSVGEVAPQVIPLPLSVDEGGLDDLRQVGPDLTPDQEADLISKGWQ